LGRQLGNHEFRRRVAFGGCVLLVACALADCRRPRGPVVATLLARQGTVERALGSGWIDAYVDFGFLPGDALRTGTASGARVRCADGSLVRVAESSRLRFQRGQLHVDRGGADIDEAGGELQVATPEGLVPLERGQLARVRFDEQARGAVVERLGASTPPEVAAVALAVPAVAAGASVAALAAVERSARPAEPPPLAEPPPAAPLPAAPAEPPPAAPSSAGTPPSEVTVVAGESAVVHDGHERPRVRLRFDHLCSAAGTVELAHGGRRRARLTGEGAVTTRLRPGRQSYRLYCAGDVRGAKPRARGALWLRRDAGDIPLARSERSTIVADGSRTTVLYQLRPPPLVLVWPGVAAPARPLRLHITSSDGERVLRVRGVETRLRAGALRHGTHTWWYAAGDGKQSPRSTLVLRFNDTAPAAQFFERDADTQPGVLSIDGVTVHGARVSAAGKPVPVDDAGRFHAAVAPEAGASAVAVRLELPRHGLHYYVRHPIAAR
jgi:hypothetical protein